MTLLRKKYFSPREKILFTFETWERQKFTRKGRMKNDLRPPNTIEKKQYILLLNVYSYVIFKFRIGIKTMFFHKHVNFKSYVTEYYV